MHTYISALAYNRWCVSKDRPTTRRLPLPCSDIVSIDDIGASAKATVLSYYGICETIVCVRRCASILRADQHGADHAVDTRGVHNATATYTQYTKDLPRLSPSDITIGFAVVSKYALANTSFLINITCPFQHITLKLPAHPSSPCRP
jgi:hypothetical protein